ncbi:MAG TPA: DUF488 family protein [Terriglobia bacterium]|nr:DUF488 family protein [Terriglobia bacterium]
MPLEIKRAYEDASRNDGRRILVDGLWPRGVRKEDAKIDEWMKTIAPSAALRKWYGHRPERWEEFRNRYRAELAKTPRKELMEQLASAAKHEKVTLIFGARDAEHSNAAVIAEAILPRIKKKM